METSEIIEIKSETACKECGGELSWGNMFMKDERNEDKYHHGCLGKAVKRQPMLSFWCKPKSWPPQRFNQGR